ncbi:radical SAM protein [Mycolicibacterium sp. jd]|uniref:radical SAM protein n=2 Tax=unclassified Mycolicibacterium TaxID=2636767 RepID=UPI00351B9126
MGAAAGTYDLRELRELTQKLNLHVPPTYFASRITRMAYEQALGPIVSADDDGPMHVYLGVPLCEEHCNFCMYFAGFADQAGEKAEACVRGLVQLMCALGQTRPRRVAGLYVGGGTPSVLSAELIAKLLSATNSAFEFEPNAQRTFEMAPRSITTDKLGAVVAAGITRGSFGVQSFDPDVLAAANRKYHPPERIRTLIDDCRRAGIAHVNVDLMVGLDGQKPDSLHVSLRHLLEMRCPTISIYRYRPMRQRELATRGGIDEYVRFCTNQLELAFTLAREYGYRTIGRTDGEHVRLLGDQPADQWSERNLYETRYRPHLGNSLVGLGAGGRSFLRSSRYVHCDRVASGFDLVGRDVAVEDCTSFDQAAAAVVNEFFINFRADPALIARTIGIDVAEVLASEIAFLTDRGVLRDVEGVLEVDSAYRPEWHYWDKVFYPPQWLARRMQSGSARLR